MTLTAALRRALVCSLLAAGVATAAGAAAAPLAMPGATDRTGPPGGAQALAGAASEEDVALGRRIYHEGLGADGKPIVGLRFGGVQAEGAAVACVTCHRRSGLGSVEGTNLVPPVAGRFIFGDDPRAVVSMNYRNIKNFNQAHDPFTDETFAAVMRHGQHPTGRELSPIMPRFELNAAELRAVASYLRTLSAAWSPGVQAHRLRLATVITPDVSQQRRKIFTDTLLAAVGQKNGNVVRVGTRTMSSAAEMLFRTDRHWDLEVWELQGTPETWAAQLDERYRARPVFALVSGLGAGQWAPVHAFCSRTQVPCWFPSVDATPASAQSDFYSLYFSAGVELEADVLAGRLAEQRPARVLQLHRGDAAGRAGAAHLSAALSRAIAVETRQVDATDAASLRRALAGLAARDAVMLWWPAADAAALDAVAVPRGTVYLSARMAGAEAAPLPGAWKAALRMVYPYQIPDRRGASLYYFKSWLKATRIELADEVLQSEVYFAMSYFSQTITEMIDNVHRDYLIERAESMLSLREGAKAEDEARELTVARHNKGSMGGTQAAMARLQVVDAQRLPRPMPGHPEQLAIKREGTTVYPRLGLAQGQRFASKGAYIARFASPGGTELVAESDWIVP